MYRYSILKKSKLVGDLQIDTFERPWKQGNFVRTLDWMNNDYDIPGDTAYGCYHFVSIFARLLYWGTSTFAIPTASTASTSSYSR